MKTILTIGFLLLISPAHAQFSTFSDDSGTTGTLYNFNNGFQSYSDSRGNTGTLYNFGNGMQSYQFNGPQGTHTGTIYTFPQMTVPPVVNTPLPMAPPFPAPIFPFGRPTNDGLRIAPLMRP